MAETTNRRINIYINGREVENNIKSIQGEMRHLQNSQAKMTIGSREYIEATKKIQTLNGVISNHRNSLKTVETAWNRVGREISNIAFGNIAANLVTQLPMLITQKIDQATTSFAEFESTLTNVLTLLSEADRAKYGQSLGNGALEVAALGFEINNVNKALFDTISAGVPAADAIMFLEEAATLAKGGVTELSVATDGMTTIINSFNLDMSEATNVANALFTAQKFGKTTVAELSNSLGKAAPLANMVGASYQELLAAEAQLTLQGISTEEGFTSIKAVFSSLLAPAEGAKKILTDLGIPFGSSALKAAGFTETMKLLNDAVAANPDLLAEAIPNIQALTGAGALMGESFDNYRVILEEVNTDIGENSSLAQASAMQDETMAVMKAKAAAQSKQLSIEIGERLVPAMKLYLQVMHGVGKAIMNIIDFITRNIKVFSILLKLTIVVTTALVSYNLAMKLAAFWTNKETGATILQTAVKKTQLFLTNAVKGATLLFAAAQALLAGNTAKATAAMRLFNTTTKLNPAGLLVAGLMAAVTAIILLIKHLNKATEVQKMMNDITKEANNRISDETAKVKQLLFFAQDETKSKEDRLKAIKLLNQISPEYFGNLDLETIKTDQATQAVNQYIEAMQQRAKIIVAQEKLVEIERELMAAQMSTVEEQRLTFVQFLTQATLYQGEMGVEDVALDTFNQRAENRLNKIKEIEEKRQALMDWLSSQNISLQDLTTTFDDTTDDGTPPPPPPGFPTEESVVETRNRFNELLEIYRKAQSEIDKIAEEARFAGMSDYQVSIVKEKEKWDALISAATAGRDELLLLGDKMTAEDLELMNNFNYQIYALEQEKYTKLAEMELQYQLDIIAKKEAAQETINEVLMSDQEREIKQVTDKYTELINLAEQNGIETVELYRKLAEEIAAINAKYAEDEGKLFFGMNQDQWDALKEKFDKFMKWVGVAQSAYSSWNEYMQKKDEENLARIEQQYSQEMSVFDRMKESQLISEETYNSKVAELNRETDREKAKIARKAAQREKAGRLFDSIINTAAAIVEALPNIPFAVAVGALGAMQTAFIAAEPIPGYAKGGRIKGQQLAMVGEKGDELIFSNDMLRNPLSGPILEQMAQMQEGKISVPNFSGMQRSINASRGGGATQSIVNNNMDNTGLETRLNSVVNETKNLNNKFDKLYNLLADKNYRIKAEINNNDFARIQTQNEFINDFTQM